LFDPGRRPLPFLRGTLSLPRVFGGIVAFNFSLPQKKKGLS